MSDELKPCPFCGAAPQVKENHYLDGYDNVIISCPGCLFAGRTGHTFEQAAEKWNSRPVEDALRAEIATLKAALAKSDPIHRVYDGTMPELECMHCGGSRGRFENDVQHAADCVWKLAGK